MGHLERPCLQVHLPVSEENTFKIEITVVTMQTYAPDTFLSLATTSPINSATSISTDNPKSTSISTAAATATSISTATATEKPLPLSTTPAIPNGRDMMRQRMQLLGSLLHLAMYSPLHHQYTIQDIEERFIPSLLHNQFRYYEIDGSPIGFVNWAWLDQDTEQKYATGQHELSLDEWHSGTHLWFPEFVAPFGHARAIVKDLRQMVFQKGTPAKALRISSDGSLKGISTYRL